MVQSGGGGGEAKEGVVERGGRVDSNTLLRLYRERRAVAGRVLAWRVGGGSRMGEVEREEIDMEKEGVVEGNLFKTLEGNLRERWRASGSGMRVFMGFGRGERGKEGWVGRRSE